MKNLLPFALIGAGLFALSGNKKSAKVSGTKKPTNQDQIQKNEQAILKYFSYDEKTGKAIPIKIMSLNEIMSNLTENLKNSVYQYSEQWYVYLKPEFAYEAYELALLDLNSTKKAATTQIQADVPTKKILIQMMPDVSWNEGITPYNFDSPFFSVWQSVSLLVMLASKNLVEKGVIK